MLRVFIIYILLAHGLVAGLLAQDSLQLNYDSLRAKIAFNQSAHQTLSMRANLVWDDGNTAQQFNANIRVQKDSVVWLSLSMFGIEGARAFITPDSFRLINKLTAEYAVKPFSFIQNWISVPVNFLMLQELIAGNVFSINPKANLVSTKDSLFVIYEESDRLQQKIQLDNQNYTVHNILLKDKLLNQDIAISFDAYNFSEPKPFSYKRSITITRTPTVMKLSIDVLRVKFDEELQYPFDVNEKYKRIEWNHNKQHTKPWH